MVTVTRGDLFASDAQTLVNTVNCVGIMGKGIALEFKRRFPDMYKDYATRCEAKEVRLGKPYLFRRLIRPWIVNFPTKDHWRSVSRLEDIVTGLRYLEDHYRQWGIESLAVPPLGCGQGQLDWRVVGPTLYRHLKRFDVPVELFAPFEAPDSELTSGFLDREGGKQGRAKESGDSPRRIDPSWIALVAILRRIEEEPYHPAIGRTTFQKIAYFATEAGLPTGLHYQRGSYGPYAADLKRHIGALVNHGLVHERRLGQMFMVEVGPTFADASRVHKESIQAWMPIVEKVADLFVRMNTQQAEVAATVHFAATDVKTRTGEAPHESEVLHAVLEWKQKRRPPLAEAEVARTIRHLNMLSWIGAQVSSDLPVSEEDLLQV